MSSLAAVVQASEADGGDEEADMEADTAESKQVYKPAKLAPVYYGQSVCFYSK